MTVADRVDVSYPFSALVGHDRLRLALVLCAVRPDIGGVLIRGEKGTAKSTAVRGLAQVLTMAFQASGGGHLVELPIGATEDRVIGSLDLQKVLRDGEHAFSPGLLARAHRGVLYVDEVNLLHDHLVDILLDAAAMGRVHIERDGVSHSHEARFVLIGTMNPEEGELRPQLLDRFGLTVDVAATQRPGETDEAEAALEDGAWALRDAKVWPLGTRANPEAAAERHARLRIASDLTQNDIRDRFGKPSAVAIWDLPDFINGLEQAGFSARRHEVWFQMELARPIFLVAMVLVAAGFTMRPARLGRTGLYVLAAVLLGFGLYYVRNFAQIMGENGQLPPLFAAWVPPVASLMLALGLVLQMEDG